ncbi:MAG: DUF4097 domain-containing protein [Actinobacteria bacterium]|nr:DUF4097 domain-containing protein [Actinomycetota bacterium]
MKFNIKKFVIVLACIMAGSFIIAGTVFYFTGGVHAVSVNSSQVKTSKVYLVEEIESIVVKTIDTKVNIIPVVDKRVDIDFYGNITTNLTEAKPELVTSLEDGVLTITISYPKTINFGLINLEKLYLDVYVPNYFNKRIEVETVSADLEMRHMTLDYFRFKTISGNLDVNLISAQNWVLELTSGNIEARQVEGGINASTISGKTAVSLNSLKGDIRVKTVSGEVEISLPDESQFDFELNSISGDIKNEFGAKISYADKKNIAGSVGDGAFKIIVDTTSGNISIKKQMKGDNDEG